jgi:hypothetical protein
MLLPLFRFIVGHAIDIMYVLLCIGDSSSCVFVPSSVRNAMKNVSCITTALFVCECAYTRL